MPDYRVRVYRKETRFTDITINAMSEGDAEIFAIQQASDIDFHKGFQRAVDYEADVVTELKPCGWDDDPVFPREDWQAEVANNDTYLGYVEWADAQREQLGLDNA